MSFDRFALDERLLAAIRDLGWIAPTPIQERAIPEVLAGRDVLGKAQTGTGKTAAFALPVLHRMLAATSRRPRLLVIEPTRELAKQAHEHIAAMARRTPLRGCAIAGGEADHVVQENTLRLGVDWVAGTPGRLLDQAMRGGLDLLGLEYLVLDEADQLLQMGFLPELQRLLSFVAENRTTLLFSATLPPETRDLARALLRKPVRIDVGETTTPDPVREEMWPVARRQKTELLRELLKAEGVRSALLFVRTKKRADSLAASLAKAGFVSEILHSDRSMPERRAALEAFRAGRTPILVATDVASRGLDIGGISHVVNVDVPGSPEDYVHRAGRTGRMGRPGTAWTLACAAEIVHVARIERLIGKRLVERKLEGFPYIADDEPDADEQSRGTRPSKFTTRKGSSKLKESPFTKSGKAKPEFAIEDAKKKQNERVKKRVKMRRRLPHER